jgi:hypothetical protein
MMTKLAAHISSVSDTTAAVSELIGSFSGAPSPQLVFAFYGEQHDDRIILERLSEVLPGVPLIGGTSSGGIIGAGHIPAPTDLALLAIYDEAGDYGVGSALINDDPRAAGRAAIEAALRNCDCEGIVPALVWVFQPPGAEEQVLHGIQDVVDNRCPIVGGSAGDDTVTGRWRQLSNEGISATRICVAVLFPGNPLATVFQSGYAPAGLGGVVTETRGRTIVSIDDLPAAQVYEAWRGGGMREAQERDGSILGASALAPLGIPSRSVAGVVQHRLVHPARINEDGSLDTFAEVATGQQIELMSGSPDSLASRAGRVLKDAVAMLPSPDGFAGGLLIYCGGCAMSLGDRVASMASAVEEAACGRPVIGAFTFGEQGVLGDTSVHGNLMVSAVAFGGQPNG